MHICSLVYSRFGASAALLPALKSAVDAGSKHWGYVVQEGRNLGLGYHMHAIASQGRSCVRISHSHTEAVCDLCYFLLAKCINWFKL